MDFLSLKHKSFGLDFSDLSIKIVSLKKRGRFLDLASWAEVKMKPGIIEEGEVKDRKSLSAVIKESFAQIKGEKIKTNKVIASLPEKRAFLQVIKMPKMKEEELKTAVPFEAENYIPLPIEEVYLDFQIVPSISGYLNDRIDVLIAAISKSMVDPYVFCLKEAGLSPLALEVESQSICRALIKNQVSLKPVLLIDFGRSRTSFIIFSGYSPRFTSSIPISSYKLTEAISDSFKIDFIAAEKIKKNYGLEGPLKNQSVKGISKNKVISAMNPILKDLVSQIKLYLNFYQSHAKDGYLLSDGRRVDRVLLCGRGANLKGLPDFLSAELKIPVELGNPWINILSPSFKKIPGISFKDSLGYTSALGLALRSIKDHD